MDEYIKRQRAIDACFDGWNNNAHDCAENIRSIPAADVQPVVRGKWIMNDECRTVCSLCGNVVAFVSHPDRRWDFGNYCPNCGADMREES